MEKPGSWPRQPRRGLPMSSSFHPCGCSRCRAGEPHVDRTLHQRINLLISRLDEQQRRWFVALEAERLGRGGEPRGSRASASSDRPDGSARSTRTRTRRAPARARPRPRLRAAGAAREVPDPACLPSMGAPPPRPPASPWVAGPTPSAPRSARRPPLGLRAATRRAARRTLARRVSPLTCPPSMPA